MNLRHHLPKYLMSEKSTASFNAVKYSKFCGAINLVQGW